MAAFAIRVLLGDYTFTVPDFFRILFGEQLPVSTFILMESKLPRAVLAVLVGLALGSAGSLFQMLLRNPLASPDIVGVSLGASAAGIFALLTLGLRDGAVSAFAVVGAVAVSVVVRWVAGTTGGYRLVLTGVGVAAAMVSVVQYLLARSSTWDVQLALRWLVGQPQQRRRGRPSASSALALAVLLPTLAVMARSLEVARARRRGRRRAGRRPAPHRRAPAGRRAADRRRGRGRRAGGLRRVHVRPDRARPDWAAGTACSPAPSSAPS